MLPRFETPEDSHKHSLITLAMLNEYDEFMASIDSVADMGCGKGLDTFWWATQRDPSPPHIPRNYNCFAIDKDLSNVKSDLKNLPNVRLQQEDFENPSLDKESIDVIWCHNSFQYAKNPLQTLKNWNNILTSGGMLYLCLPYSVNRQYNKFGGRTESGAYFHYTLSNLIYLLAISGYDCSDARMTKFHGDQYFHVACYKDTVKSVNDTSSWYELVDSGRLPKEAVNFINKTGYLDDYHLAGVWFNGSQFLFSEQ